MVTYRASRGIVDSSQQRWTVHGDRHSTAAVYDPIPSFPIKLEANPKPLKLDLSWESEDIPYHELDWPVYSLLPVADSFVDFRLWGQCYLRWIPVLDIRGGGQPPVYFNQCALVNDILSLESQLDKLQQFQLDGETDISSSPSQRFVTMSDHSPGNVTVVFIDHQFH